MAKRNQDPRKAAMRKMMGEFLKENDISLHFAPPSGRWCVESGHPAL